MSSTNPPFLDAHAFDLFPLASRPSFTGKGTDSSDYAWFLFGARHGWRFNVLEASR